MSEAMDWKLVAVSGLEDGKSFPLTDQGIQLGRSDECELVLPSQNVSRKHARVFVYQGEPYAQDLGSRNGLFVNGVRVQQQGLKEGDTLTMGEFVFAVTTGSGVVPKKSKRGLIYGVAGVVLIGVIAVAALKGNGEGSTTKTSVAMEEPAPASEINTKIYNVLGENEKANPPKPGIAKPDPAQESARDIASITVERRNRQVKLYLEQAQFLQDAGKLTEAKEYYQRALLLDPACQLCRSRQDRLEKQVAALVQRHLDDGMKAYKALRYQEAINSWELVINLSPDPGSPPHQQAVQYIANAKAKLESQRY